MNLKFWEELKKDELTEFVQRLTKLTPEEFIGLVKLMNIEIVDEDKMPRKGEDLMVEVCNSFVVRPLIQRKNLMKLVRETTRLRSYPKFNETEQAQRDSEYEEWLAEQKEKIKQMNNGVDAAVSAEVMEEN